MRLGSKWNRRSFLGSLGVIAGSVLAPRKLFASKSVTGISGFGKSGNPYDELGVTTVINCQGTMTMLGSGASSLTKLRKRRTRAGSSIVAFHSHS